MRHLDEVMNKEMTRKEFLATLGFGIASIMGFSTVLKFLFGRGSQQQAAATGGYGASAYGGQKKRA